MTKTELIKMRTILKNGKDLPLKIIDSNNIKVSNEATDFIKWDDENEIVYIIKSNNTPSHNTNMELPIEITAIPYDNILCLSIAVTNEIFKEIATVIGFTDSQKENVIKKYSFGFTDLL